MAAIMCAKASGEQAEVKRLKGDLKRLMADNPELLMRSSLAAHQAWIFPTRLSVCRSWRIFAITACCLMPSSRPRRRRSSATALTTHPGTAESIVATDLRWNVGRSAYRIPSRCKGAARGRHSSQCEGHRDAF